MKKYKFNRNCQIIVYQDNIFMSIVPAKKQKGSDPAKGSQQKGRIQLINNWIRPLFPTPFAVRR